MNWGGLRYLCSLISSFFVLALFSSQTEAITFRQPTSSGTTATQPAPAQPVQKAPVVPSAPTMLSVPAGGTVNVVVAGSQGKTRARLIPLPGRTGPFYDVQISNAAPQKLRTGQFTSFSVTIPSKVPPANYQFQFVDTATRSWQTLPGDKVQVRVLQPVKTPAPTGPVQSTSAAPPAPEVTGSTSGTRTPVAVIPTQQSTPTTTTVAPRTTSPATAAPGATSTVAEPFQKPDLAIKGVEVWVDNGSGGFLPHRKIYADSRFRFVIYIKNQGSATLPLERLWVEVNGNSSSANPGKSSLLSGEEERVSFGSTFTRPAGNHEFHVKIDSRDEIDESNEGNNELTFSFSVEPTPPEEILQADCGIVEINPTISAFPLSWNTRGDTDMHGHGPRVGIEGELHRTETRLIFRGRAVMTEADEEGKGNGDHTTFEKLIFQEIFRAPASCRIKKIVNSSGYGFSDYFGRISGTLNGSKEWQDLSNENSWSNLIQSARCLGDTEGSEAGQIGCSEVHLVPIRVYLEAVTGPVCIRQQAYLQGHVSNHYYNRGFAGIFPLQHLSGDGEMGSNDVTSTLTLELKNDRRKIWVDSFVRMVEQGDDRSTFEGGFTDEVFYAPLDAPGCYIQEVQRGGFSSSSTDSVTWTRTDGIEQTGIRNVSGSGLLKSAWCTQDTDGDDRGKIGCREIEYSESFLNIDLWPERITPPPLKNIIKQNNIRAINPVSR